MTEVSKDIGILIAVADRLVKFRLPRAKDIKQKVDQGDVLNDSDIGFLQRALRDAHSLAPLVEKHPEYQDIADKVISLYSAITEQALANEQGEP